jgi:hypothetical protein
MPDVGRKLGETQNRPSLSKGDGLFLFQDQSMKGRQNFVGNRLSPFFLRAVSDLPAGTVQIRMAYSF